MLLICMSIAGSVPLVLCILLWMIKRKNFSYWLGRDLVLLSLAGYLIPFQLVKYLLPRTVLEQVHAIQHISYMIDFDDKESVSYRGVSIWVPDWILMLLLCWLFAILLFSLYETVKYQQLTRKLKKNSVCQSKYLLGFGNVEYRVSRHIPTPYTIGFLHPFIVIPETLIDSKFSDYILKHESSHLRRHDSGIKLLCLFAICLHCFNPFALLTLFFYTWFSENIADEIATKDCSRAELKSYASTLVILSAANKQVPVVWRSSFTGSKNVMKRRIEYIMNKNIKTSKIGVAAAILGSMILSSSTVLAYSPMQTSAFDDETISIDCTMEFNNTEPISDLFKESDLYFESSDHTLTPIFNYDANPRAIICIHDFKVGYASQHIPNNTGGCTVKVYNSKKCKKCNHLVITDLIGTTKYPKCPH